MKTVKNFDGRTVVAIRIRGTTKVRVDMANAMTRLLLHKKNTCVLLNDTPDTIGSLKKSKDYITWGIVDDDTKKELIEKRGKKDDEGNYFPVFNLHPPRGGFERKGIKQPFSIGGALGNRKEKISVLLKKML